MTSIFPIIGSSALLDVDGNAGRLARDEDARLPVGRRGRLE